jgi:hypothetical protein
MGAIPCTLEGVGIRMRPPPTLAIQGWYFVVIGNGYFLGCILATPRNTVTSIQYKSFLYSKNLNPKVDFVEQLRRLKRSEKLHFPLPSNHPH